MNELIQDLSYGLRMLAKNRGFTVVAVLVLALGIGGTTAMFTITNALVLRPLPVKQPEQLVRCYGKEKKPAGAYRGFSYPNYVDLREQNTVFSDLLSFSMAKVGVTEGEKTRRTFATFVSANYFETFGVALAAGRGFLPEEERPGSAIPVVVLSHSYWVRTGADPTLVGRAIQINARSFQVVGIAPKSFAGTTSMLSPEFWIPLGMYELLCNDFMNDGKQRLADRNHHALMVVGRLKAGLTPTMAEARLQGLMSQLETAYPAENRDYTLQLGSLSRMSMNTHPHDDSGLATLSVLLMSMSGAVLLIACLNLANMLVARNAARRKEIAIRLSLGGGRGRIIRQLLTEGLLLALMGGAAGLLLSWWATDLLLASLASRVSFAVLVFDPRPDGRVLAATLLVCVLSVLFFGLGPAWRLSRLNVVGDLKEHAADDRQPKMAWSVLAPRNLLVVAQLALSLALLTAAGLFTHGAMNAAAANPGFSLDKGILVETDASLAGYDEAKARQLYARLLERLRVLPGAEAASFSYIVPFGIFSDDRNVEKAGAEAAPPNKTGSKNETPVGSGLNIVSTDYFKTLGLSLLQGRDFERLEVLSTSAARVAIVDEPLAKRLWPGESVLGRQIQFAGDKPGAPARVMQIVGVVSGVRNELGEKNPTPHVYIPFGQEYHATANFHLRIAGLSRDTEASLLKSVRATMKSVDPRVPLISVQTLRAFHNDGLLLGFVQLTARLFAVFGGLALFLAVVGVYGVKAYVVARRTREIGIRMALGATRGNVLWMILRDGLRLTLIGLGVGLLLSAGLGFLLRSWLYEVPALDLPTFVIVPAFLAAAAMLACYFPARRATAINPMNALRCE